MNELQTWEENTNENYEEKINKLTDGLKKLRIRIDQLDKSYHRVMKDTKNQIDDFCKSGSKLLQSFEVI